MKNLYHFYAVTLTLPLKMLARLDPGGGGRGFTIPTGPSITPPDPDLGIVGLFNQIMSFIAPLAFVAVLGGVVYAGFLFMTSHGEPNKLTSAKKSLTYSIIGLLVFIFSYIIVMYIIDKLK